MPSPLPRRLWDHRVPNLGGSREPPTPCRKSRGFLQTPEARVELPRHRTLSLQGCLPSVQKLGPGRSRQREARKVGRGLWWAGPAVPHSVVSLSHLSWCSSPGVPDWRGVFSMHPLHLSCSMHSPLHPCTKPGLLCTPVPDRPSQALLRGAPARGQRDWRDGSAWPGPEEAQPVASRWEAAVQVEGRLGAPRRARCGAQGGGVQLGLGLRVPPTPTPLSSRVPPFPGFLPFPSLGHAP